MDKAFEVPLGELAEVPLKLIDRDPEQPRKDFDEEYIKNELAPSIKRDGVIQPIVVRNNPDQPGRFFIVAGENRWRASKHAKTKTIPAIRREVDGIGKLLIQLKENHQRKDLNAMEWALAFQAMHKTHGLKQTEIEKTLKEAGVGNFGRAYISNHIRLLELPEWAQRLIRFNAITASHGKFLLVAMASEKVLERMRVRLTEENWAPTTSQLQGHIYAEFSRHHQNLTLSRETRFDYRDKCVKTGCQKLRKVSPGEGGGDSTFCMDKECHSILQAEALREQREQHQHDDNDDNGGESESAPREITVDADNRVDVEEQQLDFFREWRRLDGDRYDRVNFDLAGCEGCPHRHVAVIGSDTESQQEHDACFLVSCYLDKENSAKRAQKLVRRHIGSEVAKCFEASPTSAIRFLGWMAADGPEVTTGENGEELTYGEHPEMGGGEDDPFDQLLFQRRITGLRSFMGASEEDLSAIAAHAAQFMADFGNNLYDDALADLSSFFNIGPDDFRIDEHFLAEHTEEEILALFSEERVGLIVSTEIENAAKDGNLDSAALRHRDRLEVPAEIRFAFEQLLKGDD